MDSQKDGIKLILFGNAILDVGKKLENDDLHRKYNLKLDDQLEPESKTLQLIKEDLDKIAGPTHVSSGGSCLNTCKILSQLGERRTMFCGGIGADENGQILEKLLDENQIRRRLQTIDSYSTALCICLVYKESRCLLANIGASTHFDSKSTIEEVASLLPSQRSSYAADTPSLCYIEGYFIPQKMAICKLIFHRFCCIASSSHRLQLVLNLNATYIVSQYLEDVLWLFNRAHLVFGNRREFDQLLAETKSKSISELLQKETVVKNTERICIVTDGAKSVQYVRLATNNDITVSVGWVAVPKVGADSVVDSTGAGDAFVAGYLFHYLNEGRAEEEPASSVEECIRHGVEVARRKLSFLGCSLKGNGDVEEM